MDRKLQVLVVEDHAGVREVLERTIESWADVDLLSCNGFLDAAKWIHEASYIDLLLCDVCLPDGISGTDLAEITLKEHSRAAVVMTSADPRSSIPRFSERYGFIRKPYGRAELIRAIEVAFIKLGRLDVDGCMVCDKTF